MLNVNIKLFGFGNITQSTEKLAGLVSVNGVSRVLVDDEGSYRS